MSENRPLPQGKLMGKWVPDRTHELPWLLKSIAFRFSPAPPEESSQKTSKSAQKSDFFQGPNLFAKYKVFEKQVKDS
jgi:hypothetical protein